MPPQRHKKTIKSNSNSHEHEEIGSGKIGSGKNLNKLPRLTEMGNYIFLCVSYTWWVKLPVSSTC